jgi:glycosyltransferase involved in cell wall biosynthesis
MRWALKLDPSRLELKSLRRLIRSWFVVNFPGRSKSRGTTACYGKELAIIGHQFNVKCVSDMIDVSGIRKDLLPIERWNEMTKSERRRFIRQHDIMHFLWGQRNVRTFVWARLFGTKMINHYIGTDVLWLLRSSKSQKRRVYLISLLANETFCVSPNLRDELDSLNIRSDLLPIHFRESPTPLPALPEKAAAFTYIPKHRSEFYGWDLVERLIRDFPAVTFYILAHDGEDVPTYKNARFLGWQDNIEKWIRNSNIHLRLTEHDGLPKTVLESLAYGRHVIYNQEFPHCRFAGNYDELRRQFRALLKDLKLNRDGADFVREHFAPARIKEQYLNLYLQK